MNTKLAGFNRDILQLFPLSSRVSDLTLKTIMPLKDSSFSHSSLRSVASEIIAAKERKSACILMMGAHVLRSGVQRFLIDLVERGYISCIAMNGAGVIHDFEFALIGATTERVAHYIKDGRFGFWRETSRINDIVTEGAKEGIGLGEAVGRVIEEERFPHKQISILAAGYRLRIPITVHVGIGYDIVFQYPNCDGGAYGATSYLDFLRYTKVLESIEGGVVMNFGSAVMAPEVFLKALSMARNAARRNGGQISNFTVLVCDLLALPEDVHEEPTKDNPHYYFRPWKTMLVRTVSDGGKSFYVQGRHSETIPGLWTALSELER